MPLTPAQIQAQADSQRASYIAKCEYRRKGKTIQRKYGDEWVDSDTFPSFAKAKRHVRTNPSQFEGNLYVA